MFGPNSKLAAAFLGASIGWAEASLNAQEAKSEPVPSKQSVLTDFSESYARSLTAPAEVKYVIDGLDSDEYRVRQKAHDYLEKNAKRLVPALIEATALAKSGLEARIAIIGTAEAHGIKIEFPERENLKAVEWAVNNIGTESGAVRHAVFEVLSCNPLFYAQPDWVKKLDSEPFGRKLIVSVDTLAAERPLEFVEALNKMPASALQEMFERDSGRGLVVQGVSNALRETLKGATKLSEAKQVQLLGSPQREIDALVRSKLGSAADFPVALSLLARAARVTSCIQRIENLKFNYDQEGFVLLEAAASQDSKQAKILEDIFVGIENHQQFEVAKVGPFHPAGLDCVLIGVGAKYENAEGLWQIALNEPAYNSWLEPRGRKTTDIVRIAVTAPHELEEKDFLMICWEAAVIAKLSPDGKEPSKGFATLASEVHANIAANPPLASDVWKIEKLDDWLTVLKSVDKLNLRAELYPAALMRQSLPPNHVGGQGTAYGALDMYATFVQIAYQNGTLTLQSEDVVRTTLEKLTPPTKWFPLHCEQSLELIGSIESTAKELAKSGISREEIAARLGAIRDNGLNLIDNPPPPPVSVAPEVKPAETEKNPTIESLERVLRIMRSFPER